MRQPKEPVDKKIADAQWDFVQNALKMSKSDFLFAAGHYPIYSTSYHGSTPCLVDRLQPMLDTYGASGYLAGHEHNFEHLQVKSSAGNNIDYIISGMGSTVGPCLNNSGVVPPGSSLYRYCSIVSKGGFVYAEVTQFNMTLILINGNGEQLYSTTVWPRKI